MKIVIVGGGFCGSLIAKNLEKSKSFNVTLIDKKDYFEFSPSVHKVLFNPDYHKKIIVPFKRFLKQTNFIVGDPKRVTPKFVEINNKKIYFDFLVISTGINYPIFLENKKNVFTMKSGIEVKKLVNKILKSKNILIAGGGLIGTEISGELVTKTRNKNIIIVHTHDRLLERNSLKASKYAETFLVARGAKIIFNDKVIKNKNQIFSTSKAELIKSDICIWCAGISSNPTFMKGFNKNIFTENKFLNVNKFLQLEGYPNIFIGGDINSFNEEKTAQNAKRHAALISKNLGKVIEHQKLISYKKVVGPMVISLGDWSGIMVTKSYTITGYFPALVKKIIEWWNIKHLIFK